METLRLRLWQVETLVTWALGCGNAGGLLDDAVETHSHVG